MVDQAPQSPKPDQPANIIACVDGGVITRHVIDRAIKEYHESDANLYVIYVRIDHPLDQLPHREEDIAKHFRHAEKHGATILRQQASCVQDGLQSALENLDPPITSKLFIGGPTGRTLFCKFRTTIRDMLTDGWPGIRVEMVDYPDRWTMVKKNVKNFAKLMTWPLIMIPATMSFVLGGVLLGLDRIAPGAINIPIASLVFLLGGLIASRFYGMVGGMAQTVVGLCLLIVGMGMGTGTLLANGLSIFLYAAIGFGLAYFYGGARSRNVETATREERIKVLYRVGRDAGRYNTQSKVLEILHQGFEEDTNLTIGFFLPRDNDGRAFESYPDDLNLPDHLLNEIEVCYNQGLSTGLGTRDDFDDNWRFEPMVTAKGIIGVTAIRINDDRRITPDFNQFTAALADQAAIALERVAISDEIEQAHIREEREKLRVMLLSSVSHDLKTPLSSIIGSLSSLKVMGDRLPMESQNILIDTALEEAERLNQFITNILNMTRLESREIEFDQEWVDPDEIIREVTHRLRHHLTNHQVKVEVDDPVIIHTDPTMMAQVIQNMVDNAIKYSPAGSQIGIIGQKTDDGYQIMITDEGQGIDDNQRQAIFDKYERLQHTDSTTAGTGLGLAICRAIMEAQGGQATVLTKQDLQNHSDDRLNGHDGAVFILTFPDVDLKSKNKEKWTRQSKKQTEKQS